MSGIEEDVPRTKPQSPVGTIGAGLVVALIGAFLVATAVPAGVFIGLVVAAVGGLLAMVGVIAAGVRLGMDWVAFDRGR